MKIDETVLRTLMEEKARPLGMEQLVYLRECVAWYNSKIWPNPTQHGANPSEIVKVNGGYVIQCVLSKHTFTPGEWAHYFHDMYRRAVGDSEAAARVAARRDIMNSLQT